MDDKPKPNIMPLLFAVGIITLGIIFLTQIVQAASAQDLLTHYWPALLLFISFLFINSPDAEGRRVGYGFFFVSTLIILGRLDLFKSTASQTVIAVFLILFGMGFVLYLMAKFNRQ